MSGWLARAFVLPLLDAVNDSPQVLTRHDFYALKERLLRRFAETDGVDVQHVVHDCWNCHGVGCFRCTNGVYRERYVRLNRWRWGRHSFHTFGGVIPVSGADRPPAVHIQGFVQHRRKRWPHVASEAWYWLALWYDRPALGRDWGHSYHYRAWTPLVLLSNLTYKVREWSRRTAASQDDLPF